MAESAEHSCPCPEDPDDGNRETEMKNSESEKTSPQMDAGGQSTDPKPEGAPKESPEVKGASIPDNPGPSPDIEMDAGGQSTDPQGDKPEGAPKESPEEKGASIPDDPGPSPDIEMDTGGQSTDPQGVKPEGAPKESPEEKGASMGHESGRRPFNIKSEFHKDVLLDHLKGVIYGNCIGDAIGLLTEFMTKEEAKRIYVDKNHPGTSTKQKFTSGVKKTFGIKNPRPDLEYSMKYDDGHRYRWETGDWTDDSDQMILILQTLLDNAGTVVASDFARKLIRWRRKGFEELGDIGGMGIGRTTSFVLGHPDFIKDPHKAAEYVWETSGRTVAPNGGVMRTSILGTHDFGNIDKVIENTVIACKVTHADPRCIASCVAVTTAIAMMLQGKHWTESKGYNVKGIIKDTYDYASSTLETEEQKEELKSYMYNESLEWLKLDEPGKIGYTYKCMGAGFWSLRQEKFRESLQDITFEGGDADTNGAVAGALLGCKLGAHALPPSWLEEYEKGKDPSPDTWIRGLKHKVWLDGHIKRYLELLGLSDC